MNVNFIRCNNSANTIVVHQAEPCLDLLGIEHNYGQSMHHLASKGAGGWRRPEIFALEEDAKPLGLSLDL